MRTFGRGIVGLLAGLAVTCGAPPEFENLSPGAEIKLETRSGSTIGGRVVDAGDERVVVEQTDGVKLAVRREEIVALESSESAAGEEAEAGRAAPTRVEGDPAILYREVTVPAATALAVSLQTPVASDASKPEDPVRARVTSAVSVGNAIAIPEGSTLLGRVTTAERSGRVKGRARLALRFDTLALPGSDEQYEITTGALAEVAPGTKREDAAKIALPAIGGAIIGGIAGGKKGAVIGSAVGGGTGTAVVLGTRGEEVRLERGTRLNLELQAPVTIRISPSDAPGSAPAPPTP